MSRAMKIVLAYDGSDCADQALRSLRSAGIPDGSEIVVYSVSEWFPVPIAPGGAELLIERPLGNREEAIRLADLAASQVKADHPTWTVRAEGCVGLPGHEVIQYADKWGAELIVTGSHGRSAFSRFFLGSVSYQILSNAQGIVRIGRERAEDVETGPATILLAVDGSEFTPLILDAVSHRSWPAGTGFTILTAAEYAYDDRAEEESIQRLRDLHGNIEGRLREFGYETQSIIDTHLIHPREVILSEAKRVGADCIFMGARGLTGFERVVLGSVSSAVAMQATCSVEIIHGRRAGTPL